MVLDYDWILFLILLKNQFLARGFFIFKFVYKLKKLLDLLLILYFLCCISEIQLEIEERW